MTGGLRRHRRIVRYGVGSLCRRWRKNVAAVGVYGAVIFALASVVFLTQSLTQASVASLRSEPEIMVQQLRAGRHGFTPVGEAAGLTRMAGVQEASPRLWAYYVDLATGELLLLRAAEESPLRPHEATVRAELLRRCGLAVGGVFRLTGPAGEPVALTVAGVAETASLLESAAAVTVSPAMLRALSRLPDGQAMVLALQVRNRRELATIAAKIGESRPAARSFGTS